MENPLRIPNGESTQYDWVRITPCAKIGWYHNFKVNVKEF